MVAAAALMFNERIQKWPTATSNMLNERHGEQTVKLLLLIAQPVIRLYVIYHLRDRLIYKPPLAALPTGFFMEEQ